VRASRQDVPVVLMENLQDNDDNVPYKPLARLRKPVGRKQLIDEISKFDPPEERPAPQAAAPPPAEREQGAREKPAIVEACTNDTDEPIVERVGNRVTTPRLMRVLAAEDNKTNRLVFSKLVGQLDIELEFAENGEEAVEKWKSFQPDIIFMDISMPIMDGKEATRNIREMEAKSARDPTPIVALTAHAMSGDDDESLAAGLSFYLTKPLKKDAIFEQIRLAAPSDAIPPFPQRNLSEKGRIAAT
jgi:CheY-like chemotaxis protein